MSRTCKGYEPTIVGWKTFDGGSTHSASSKMSQNQRESSSSCGSALSPTSTSAQDWLNSPSTPDSPLLIAPNEYRNSAQHVILVKQEPDAMRRFESPDEYSAYTTSPRSMARSDSFDDSDGSGSELVLARGSPFKRRRTDSVEEIVRICAPPKLFDDVTLKAIHFYKAKTIHQIGKSSLSSFNKS